MGLLALGDGNLRLAGGRIGEGLKRLGMLRAREG